MIHKISELCDKVDVLKNKADKLRKDKYNSKEKVPTVIIDEPVSYTHLTLPTNREV